MVMVSDLVARFRSEQRDDAKPYLWKDSQLVAWLNEGIAEYARRTQGFHDRRSRVCKVLVKAGDNDVDLHPSIYRVLRAHWNERHAIEQYPALEIDRGLMPKGTGTPRLMVIVGNELSMYPAPAQDGHLYLEVLRIQIDPLRMTDEIDMIPWEDHESLLQFMCYRAYSIADIEVYDTAKADKNRALFSVQCQVAYERNSQFRGDNFHQIKYQGL